MVKTPVRCPYIAHICAAMGAYVVLERGAKRAVDCLGQGFSAWCGAGLRARLPLRPRAADVAGSGIVIRRLVACYLSVGAMIADFSKLLSKKLRCDIAARFGASTL
jgi:hypothetical protein